MYKPLYETKRCELFEEIAEKTWRSIIRAKRVGVNRDEPGITKDIIVDLLDFSNNRYRNFDVYARSSWREDLYGSDIDVFVETRSGKYRWFALQAKVLKTSGRYTTLRDSSDTIMQWDKLILLEGISGCTSFYLLYNGLDNWRYTGRDSCDREFEESQFGCSLVKPAIIEHFATKVDSRGNFINPSFGNIHPSHALPWCILTCCYQGGGRNILYPEREVAESRKSYMKIEAVPQFEDVVLRANDQVAEAENNPIVVASREAKWNPRLKLIIKQTA